MTQTSTAFRYCSNLGHSGPCDLDLDVMVAFPSTVKIREVLDRAVYWCGTAWADMTDDPDVQADVTLARELLAGTSPTPAHAAAAQRLMDEAHDYAATNNYGDDPDCDEVERALGVAPWPLICWVR